MYLSYDPGSVEHRAQVILYTLLMTDRYGIPVNSGLLVYTQTGHMTGVPGPIREKQALVMKRNDLARYLALDKNAQQKIPG